MIFYKNKTPLIPHWAQEAAKPRFHSYLSLIMQLKRSRTHFPETDPVRAFSQWPKLSERLHTVLFPINAHFDPVYFTIVEHLLSSIQKKNPRWNHQNMTQV